MLVSTPTLPTGMPSVGPVNSIHHSIPASLATVQMEASMNGQKDTTFTKIFVGGLPYHTTDKSLREHFEVYGEIEEAVVITDRQTGKSRGYGFVTMADRSGAERATKDPNPVIDGRKANVNLAYLGAKPRGQTATFAYQPTAAAAAARMFVPQQLTTSATYGVPAPTAPTSYIYTGGLPFAPTAAHYPYFATTQQAAHLNSSAVTGAQFTSADYINAINAAAMYHAGAPSAAPTFDYISAFQPGATSIPTQLMGYPYGLTHASGAAGSVIPTVPTAYQTTVSAPQPTSAMPESARM